eukprot:jgi/Botrbrau1/22092/Bobra.0206s0018.1
MNVETSEHQHILLSPSFSEDLLGDGLTEWLNDLAGCEECHLLDLETCRERVSVHKALYVTQASTDEHTSRVFPPVPPGICNEDSGVELSKGFVGNDCWAPCCKTFVSRGGSELNPSRRKPPVCSPARDGSMHMRNWHPTAKLRVCLLKLSQFRHQKQQSSKEMTCKTQPSGLFEDMGDDILSAWACA